MTRYVHQAFALCIALGIVHISLLAQPVHGTRELRWFDATNTNYIGLTGPNTGGNFTLLLPTAGPTANSNSMLLVNNAAAPWQLSWQATSNVPGNVLVISSGAPTWDQPFWFTGGNTFGGTPTATALGASPVATTRWIGTNTATDFRIGTNNVIRGILSATTGILSLHRDIYVNSSGNGDNGVRVGRGAGTVTTENTVVGDGALGVNTTGASNTAVGFNALFSNTTGSFNSAMGAGALSSNTTGTNNTAMGAGALQLNVSGSNNSAFGYQALNKSTGIMNTAIGAYAMLNATAADSNVAVGAEALRVLTTGRGNVAIGFQAGSNTTTGSRNIFIGPLAGVSLNSGQSDQFILGGASTGGAAYNPLMYGRLDLGRLWVNPQSTSPAVPGAHLHVTSGSAGVRPLALRAASGQIADLIQAESNLGRVIFSVNATGGLDFRPAPVVAPAVQQTREFRLYDLDGDYIGFKAPNNIDAADARVWTLPGTYGAQGDYLTSNTAGVLQWLSGFIYPPYVYNNASNAGNTESPETFILGSIPDNPTNIALGLNQAANNTGVGFDVFKNLKTADDNTALGHRSLYTLTGTIGVTAYGNSGGSRNVAIGKDVMYNADGAVATHANENVAVGTSALYNLTIASRAVAIGYESQFSTPGANGNVAVGWRSMRALTTGTSNVAVGESAMTSVTTGSNNTAIGAGSLSLLTSGASNTAIGMNALQSVTTGSFNLAVGSLALASLSTGSNNLAIGTSALRFPGVASGGNTAIGVQSMQGQAAGIVTNSSVGIGYQTLLNITGTATTSNVAIGASALRGSTTTPWLTGSSNVAIGTNSLVNATSAVTNVAIGSSSMANATSASSNVALGSLALRGAATFSTGSNNVALGASALAGVTTGGSNTAIGSNALGATTTGIQNVSIGVNTLISATSASQNIAIGNGALQSVTTTGNNIAIGHNSNNNSQTGASNISIGTESMLGTTTPRLTGSNNVGVGHTTLRSIRATAQSNTAIGSLALASIQEASGNTAVGTGALTAYTTPGFAASNSRNTAIGDSAMALLTTGIRNVGVGTRAMHSSTTAFDNTAIGDSALYWQTTGSNNVAIGKSAMFSVTGANALTGTNNVAIGNLAMRDIRTTSATNTAVGTSAMQSILTATGNVALGASAGFNNQSNSNRLYIGNTASTALIHGDFASGRVMINATGMTTNALSAPTINAALDIRTMSAEDRGLVIRTAAGATANAFEVQDNVGAVRFAVSPSGNLSAINGVAYTWPTALPAAAAAGQLGSGIMEVTNTGTMSFRQFVVVQANNLDFPNTLAQATSDIDVAVVGAVVGDVVQLGTPVPAANTMYTAWVQADDLVRIRLHNYDAVNAADPAAANFKITVIK